MFQALQPCPRSNASAPVHHKLVLQAGGDCFATSEQPEIICLWGGFSLKILNFSFTRTLTVSSLLLLVIPGDQGPQPGVLAPEYTRDAGPTTTAPIRSARSMHMVFWEPGLKKLTTDLGLNAHKNYVQNYFKSKLKFCMDAQWLKHFVPMLLYDSVKCQAQKYDIYIIRCK